MSDLAFSCGVEPVDVCAPLSSALSECADFGADFVVVPLVHPRLKRDASGISDLRDEPLTRTDTTLPSKQWGSVIVGKVSDWIDLDAPVSHERKASLKAFREEIAWSTHLGVPAVLLPAPSFLPKVECVNYAHALNQLVQKSYHLHAWVRVPLTASCPVGAAQDTWGVWNTLASLCERHASIHVALELTGDLPSETAIRRWVSEPVKAVIVPTSIFITNSKGFPALTRAHQQLVADLYQHGVQFILSGRPSHEAGAQYYISYLEQVVATSLPESTEKAEFEFAYRDVLQAALQPLMDHLPSETYETFERDATKYRIYEEAIELAIRAHDAPRTVIMVVGAGRGPLVQASLRAADAAGRVVTVFAVEKNPNAIITLRNLRESDWGDRVTVVHQDMRFYDPPEKADILVSELLGSWGDNELSPECLDGAQKFLKPTGVSIPCEYTSFLQPVSTSKLWNDVKAYDERKGLETQYVVKLHNFMSLDESKPCFTFRHPNRSDIIDNTRYKKCEFDACETAMLHGFAGYFEAKLFGDVMISINPSTHSEGMFSWFPIYIPIKAPMLVNRGEKIAVHFWRNVEEKKVWYEWSITAPSVSCVHNVNGRSHWIGL